MSTPADNVYKAVMGIDLGIYVGESMADNPETRLIHISEPMLNLTAETEDMDIIATGLFKAYVMGDLDMAITYTMRRFRVNGQDPPDIAAIRRAFRTRTPVSVKAVDSAIGTMLWDFIVTKMDENRVKSKVVSWSVEMKPTYCGRAAEFTEETADGGG